MPGVLEVGCQCGRVRYRITGDPVGLAVCHCQSCQRQSGSAFGMSLAVPEDSFRVLTGELKTFVMRCESGRLKECVFCPECGCRIYHSTGDAVVSVKAGTLDDTSRLNPREHYWTTFKQPWVPIAAESLCFTDDG
jgi:hypothetical protein